MALPYTHDNHLRTGWIRSASGQSRYATMIGECRRKPDLAIEESARAAQLIRQAFGPDLVLCMSGGIDSENMARAFIHAGLSFRVAIARYQPGALNHGDIDDALKFCDVHSIRATIYDIDLCEFFLSEHNLSYGRKYACRSPQLAVHLQLLDLLRRDRPTAIPVLGWNPCEIFWQKEQRKIVVFVPREPHLCYLRYFSSQRIAGVPYFFAYTPEQIAAFWQTPRFQSDLEAVSLYGKNDPAFMSLNSSAQGYALGLEPCLYEAKVEKYQQGGLMAPARGQKKTGFEEAKLFFRDLLLAQGKIGDAFPHEPFNHFFRRPLEELNPYPEPVQLIPKSIFPRPELL